MPFEMSGEFPPFSSKSRVGDFCSLKLRILDPHPSLESYTFRTLPEQAMPALAQRADIVRRAAYVRFVWGKADMTGKRRDFRVWIRTGPPLLCHLLARSAELCREILEFRETVFHGEDSLGNRAEGV